MTTYKLILFTTGKNARTDAIAAGLHDILKEHLNGKYHLEVIDVVENPRRAEEKKVLATPTLIKESPPPERRLIGNLLNGSRIMDFITG